MTTAANYQQGQQFENDENVDEELELSASKQAIAMATLAAWHLRRWVVFVPIFGVIFLGIGFMWFQSVRAEAAINERSEQLSVLLDQPAPQPDLLLQQAGGWERAYSVVLDNRVARPEDSDLVERVLDAAADSGVVIVETGTTLDGVEIIENESYTVTPVLISAIGTLDGIEAYLQLLETDEFAAFEIEAAFVEEDLVGYRLTMRGVNYSLPENFAEVPVENDQVVEVTPIVPVDGGNAR